MKKSPMLVKGKMLLGRIINVVNLSGSKRNLHNTKTLDYFFQKDKKSSNEVPYRVKYDKLPEPERNFFQQSKESLRIIKGEFKKLWRETVDPFAITPTLLYRKGEVDVKYRFDGDPKCLENWITTCDSDHGLGYSTARLDLSPTGKGVFHGNLQTRLPKDGKLHRSGFCNITTVPLLGPFFRERPHDWCNYNHLVMYIRGDGRTYAINLGHFIDMDIAWNDLHSYLLYTRGGPYWQYVKIPFSKFVFNSKGCIQNANCPMHPWAIKNVGITLADKINGPFKLEISYIGVENDPSHVEEFAYEEYNFEKAIPG